MQNKLLFFMGSLLLLVTQGCQSHNSKYLIDSRLNIKNYGFAYCMRQLTNEKQSLSYLDYSRAQGIYFEIGSHNNPNAYSAIQKFVNNNIKEYKFKNFQGNNTLYTCLQIYNNPNFNDLVRNQDKFITPQSNNGKILNVLD